MLLLLLSFTETAGTHKAWTTTASIYNIHIDSCPGQLDPGRWDAGQHDTGQHDAGQHWVPQDSFPDDILWNRPHRALSGFGFTPRFIFGISNRSRFKWW